MSETNGHAVGERVREAREKAKLSQTDLAALAGATQCTISRIETGEQHPTLDTVVKLARALGIDPSRLDDRLKIRKERR